MKHNQKKNLSKETGLEKKSDDVNKDLKTAITNCSMI